MLRAALISLCLAGTAVAETWTVDDDGKADFDGIVDISDLLIVIAGWGPCE